MVAEKTRYNTFSVSIANCASGGPSEVRNGHNPRATSPAQAAVELALDNTDETCARHLFFSLRLFPDPDHFLRTVLANPIFY